MPLHIRLMSHRAVGHQFEARGKPHQSRYLACSEDLVVNVSAFRFRQFSTQNSPFRNSGKNVRARRNRSFATLIAAEQHCALIPVIKPLAGVTPKRS